MLSAISPHILHKGLQCAKFQIVQEWMKFKSYIRELSKVFSV